MTELVPLPTSSEPLKNALVREHLAVPQQVVESYLNGIYTSLLSTVDDGAVSVSVVNDLFLVTVTGLLGDRDATAHKLKLYRESLES